MKTIDWGNITPEGANTEANVFLFIYNHDLTSQEKVDRTIRFILGRLYYYEYHLPENPIHAIKIDIRGQVISKMTHEFIEKEIRSKYAGQNSMTIEIIKE
jgi:hypothetical protein